MSQDCFSIFAQIAEKKIKEAMDRGEFDNLPGHGRPLAIEDDSHIPPQFRLAYRILKNAGYTHPEVEERKEIENIENMLSFCRDEKEIYQKVKKLNFLITRINVRRNRPVYLEVEEIYYQKVLEKIKIKKSC